MNDPDEYAIVRTYAQSTQAHDEYRRTWHESIYEKQMPYLYEEVEDCYLREEWEQFWATVTPDD